MSEPDVTAVDPPLLTTKLHAPVRRRGMVERPRLTDRFVASDMPALTLVSAPAGFGKTTLVAGWVSGGNHERRQTAWLSLDSGDNDPAMFWRYVVAAVQTVAPDMGGEALAQLRASQPSTSVVTSLVNDLASLDGHLVLVLDDFHAIESTELHEAVASLLEHLPPQVHLVLAGRADPPLPLARMRARGELLEIRAADLRFSTDEATSYLNESMGLALTPADVDALESRTEGWVAALQLAALSMQGRADPGAFVSDFAGDDRFVVDYLAEEVLERQPDDVRSFLLETSILDRLSGPLCDAVTGGTDGKSMLEQLDRANLFLVPLDDRRLWYRYHHLFADVLRARLLDDGPDHVDELHRRASAWYEAAGDQSEAIAHATAGHDVERAARLIELAALSLFQARQEWTARRWLGALPDELYADRPVLSILKVGALMISGEVAGVPQLLDDIERWLDPDADITNAIVFDDAEFARLPAQVAIYRAALSLIGGDIDATIDYANRALELAEPTDHLQRGSAAALVGLAEWTKGELDAATRHYADSIDELTAAGHTSDVLGCSIALADMRIVQGRLSDAQRTFENALELAKSEVALRGTADMHVGLSEVLLDRNDLVGARKHLDVDAQLGEAAGLPQHAYRWRVATARLRQAEGDLAAAIALFEEAERLYNTDMSPPVRPVTALKVRAHIANGDLTLARRWAASNGLTPDDELAYVREYEHVTLARVLLADGATGDAARLLDRLSDAAATGGRAGTLVEILILQSLVRDLEGDRARATTTLAEALARAEPEGFRRVFDDELPALLPLLRAVPVGAPGGRLAGELLASGGPPATHRPSAQQGLVDPLSDRELDVLHLLRSELSGPDIARELHVSLNTLRTHTKNIYSKLGATNRREAVRRAAELNL